MMNQKLPYYDLIQDLIDLGKAFKELADSEHPIKQDSIKLNGWFTEPGIDFALKAWASSLEETKILKWLSQYPELSEVWNQGGKEIQKVGLILAGNIPLVGFHDILTSLVSGKKVLIKLSSQDSLLIPHIIHTYLEKMKSFAGKIEITDRIQNIDLILATGSNNSSRYFEYYFGKYPNIIRKNRHSIAILTGEETQEEILDLGRDIFLYYGLGCRNVSKILVPRDYNFIRLLDVLEAYREKMGNNKYLNNVQYQNALLQLKGKHFYQNGFLYLQEDSSLSSPISLVFYEYYDPTTIQSILQSQEDQIQCIVGNESYLSSKHIPVRDLPVKITPFGKSQSPELWDYADQIDTLKFLLQN